MKLKKIIRFLLFAGAVSLFLAAIRIAVYFHVMDSSLDVPERLVVLCFFAFWIGAMVFIAGLLTEKETAKAKQRRDSIGLGLFLLAGSIIGVLAAQVMFNTGV